MADQKRTVTVQFDEQAVRRMEQVKKETGLSFSAQINLAMKGYEIVQRQASVERRVPPKSKRLAAREARQESDAAPA